MQHRKKTRYVGYHRIEKSMFMSLIKHGAIRTTITKARIIRPNLEKLVTKGKKYILTQSLHLIRCIEAKIGNDISNIFIERCKKSMEREGGYLRILKLGRRVGDNSEMALISFVDK